MSDINEPLEQESESATLGQILVEARHACQLSQSDLAARICLAVNVIDDIENNRLDSNINPLFAKGYIKSYAKVVDADQELVLQLFELQYQSCGATEKMQSFSQRNKTRTHNSYLNVVTVLIILGFAAMIIAWWWQQRSDTTNLDNGSAAPAEISQLQSSVDLESRELNTIVPALTPVLQPGTTTGKATDTTADSAIVVNNVADDKPPGVIKQEIEFTFSKDCWVKVTDASNEVLAIGIKKAGRVMKINGVAPFEVTLGAPEAVSINYQGTPLDITPFITGKTARFSVPTE